MAKNMRLTALLLLGGLLGLTPISSADEAALIPSITVVGSGKALAKPDQGEINVGVVTQRPAAVDAVKENGAAVRKVMQRLKEMGVAAEDVKTNNLSLQPVYSRRDNTRETPRIIGYEVNNQVRIIVRNLDQMGSILDAVVREGANRLNGVSFTVADPTPFLDQARTEAVRDARRKAGLYAGAAGVALGPLLSVQEVQPHLPRPQQFRLAQTAEAAVPIAPGQLNFDASITLIYRIASKEVR